MSHSPSATSDRAGRKPLLERARRKARRWLGLARPYQDKRPGGTERRWELISAQLGPEDRNLLDLGCDLGVLTRKAAESGRLALGMEIAPRLVRKARARHRDVPGLGFVCQGMSPDSVRRLPEFDIVLCLSVHHYWAREFGLEASWKMMEVLLRKTRRKLFFEPASVRKKYREAAPDIVDLDRESIVASNARSLAAAAGEGWRVRLLGETPCLGREPFRLLFLAERQ